VTDPENDFLKTALDACRSNIVQQETELKKLNEGLDIRNKRIMQLENQIGVSASFMSNRDAGVGESTPTGYSDSLSKVNDCLNLLLAKLTTVTNQSATKTQSVNVYNNACHHQKPEMASKHTQTIESSSIRDKPTDAHIETASSQTTWNNEEDHAEAVLQCTICNKTLETSAHLDSHIESVHGYLSPVPASVSVSCASCDARFPSSKELQHHMLQKHTSLNPSCPDCNLKERREKNFY
jgi:uncharacterized C2H2 Zn-finger protein